MARRPLPPPDREARAIEADLALAELEAAQGRALDVARAVAATGAGRGLAGSLPAALSARLRELRQALREEQAAATRLERAALLAFGPARRDPTEPHQAAQDRSGAAPSTRRPSPAR